jgi:acyl carrier protein phosphodiesterase
MKIDMECYKSNEIKVKAVCLGLLWDHIMQKNFKTALYEGEC